MKPFVLLIAGILWVMPMGKASAQGHDMYCDQADSTAASMACVKKHHESAQNRLNQIYQSLVDTVEGEVLESARDLQQDWLAYRDRECAFEAARTDNESLQRLYELSCLARMTQDRADLLAVTLQDESAEKGMSREFSAFPRWVNMLTHDYPDVFWRYGKRERVDLDCDQELEIVTAGIAPTKAALAENSNDEPSLEGYTPQGLDVVIAVVENPGIGRPAAQLFRFPVSEGQENPSLCEPVVSLTVIEDQAKLEQAHIIKTGLNGAVVTPGKKPDEEEIISCPRILNITNKRCAGIIHLQWTGKEYHVEHQSELSE